MRSLPAGILLEGPHGQDVFVCHASPGNLDKSPLQGLDARMEKALKAVRAKVVVVGHLHKAWHRYWQGKLLIMAGSCGLPLRGKLDEVDYLLLTHTGQAWQFAYKTVKYDYQAAIQDIIGSDILRQSGPIGWLMFDEALTQHDRLVPFLNEYCPAERPDDMENWKKLVIGYLGTLRRWETVKPYVQHLL